MRVNSRDGHRKPVDTTIKFDLWSKLQNATDGTVVLNRGELRQLTNVGMVTKPTRWVQGEPVDLTEFGAAVARQLPGLPDTLPEPTPGEEARAAQRYELTADELAVLRNWVPDVLMATPTGEREPVRDSWRRGGRRSRTLAKLGRLGYVTTGVSGVSLDEEGEKITDVPALVWRRTPLGVLVA